MKWIWKSCGQDVVLCSACHVIPVTMIQVAIPVFVALCSILYMICTAPPPPSSSLTGLCVTAVPGHIAAPLLPSPLFFVPGSSLWLLPLGRSSPHVSLGDPSLTTAHHFFFLESFSTVLPSNCNAELKPPQWPAVLDWQGIGSSSVFRSVGFSAADCRIQCWVKTLPPFTVIWVANFPGTREVLCI